MAEQITRDRAALTPGGCDCHRCGAVFVGEPWHEICGVCLAWLERATIQPRRLDDAGRCCGRKPLIYKRPALHFFCTRCSGEYGAGGQQQQNWAWIADGDGLRARYPERPDYWPILSSSEAA